jgi:hypothetical protein
MLVGLAAPLAAQPKPAALPVTPAAQQLFERDWVLMNWALKFYDRNGDGRVTPDEYRAAREFILARY